MALVFYYDVVCPFAYLASTQVEALARAAGTTVDWRPVLLGGIFRAVGSPDSPSATRAPARVRLEALDLLRQAERLGVPVHHNPKHPQRSVEAMRLLTAADAATRPALSHALFRHYHEAGGDLDRESLAPLAAAHGVSLARLDDDAVRDGLRATTDAAVADGAFGVPTFVVDGHRYYGVDSLPLVASALGVTWGGALRPADGVRRRLTFFHDVASPWSYLGFRQLDALVGATGAQVEVVPILLGALFKSVGTPLVPIQATSAAQQAWTLRALRLTAHRAGVPFQFTSTFPLRTVTAGRVCVVEPAATAALYQAAWADDRDVGDEAVLRDVLDTAGFDGAALIDAAGSPAAKAGLKANTDRAIAAGVCGAPSYLVDDRLLFWGQDRQDMVHDALCGWEPVAG